MIYHVYILYSLLRDRYYIGHTGDIIEERLRRHNTSHKGYSGHTSDWEIVYTEVYNTKEEARINGKERSSPGKETWKGFRMQKKWKKKPGDFGNWPRISDNWHSK